MSLPVGVAQQLLKSSTKVVELVVKIVTNVIGMVIAEVVTFPEEMVQVLSPRDGKFRFVRASRTGEIGRDKSGQGACMGINGSLILGTKGIKVPRMVVATAD